MNKDELVRRLARESHRSQAQAADDVDTLVYRLLVELRRHTAPARKDRVKAAGWASTPKAKS
jgi:hypothetical protein